MTQEEKKLLFIDICARLPYYPYALFDLDKKFDVGLQVPIIGMVNKGNTGVIKYNQEFYAYGCMTPFSIDELRIYLRPMSSMTEEEVIEFNNIPSTKNYQIVKGDLPWDVANYKQIDWLLSHHFDYRGLIKKGLAIEVTKENNPYKNYIICLKFILKEYVKNFFL